MSQPVSSAPAAQSAAPSAGSLPRETTAAIDASCRWPLVLLLGCATLWLVVSTALGIIASIKLHAPNFLADSVWLTVGRVRPAAMNAFLYGFAMQAGLGLGLWMMARLGGRRLLYPGAVFVAGLVWNFAVKYGVLGVLIAGPTGFEWLEMPPFAHALLWIAYLLMAVSALLNFALRREPVLYVSQWYLVAALFWFAWVYAAAGYLLLHDPVRGVLQAAVNAWFTGNVLHLWLTPLGLAVIFYFIPKLTGRPLHNYWLAVFGFWTLVFFGGWAGLAAHVGGPLPRWMVSAGVTANGLMVVPLVAVAWNWHATLTGEYGRWKNDWIFRFLLAGAGAYVVSALAGIGLGFKSVAALTQLTLAPAGQLQLTLHGFVGLTLFGAMYYILPRLLGVDWPSQKLIRFHFLTSLIGVLIMFGALTVGGLIQGVRLTYPDPEFLAIIKGTIPFLGNASLGLLVLLAGQVALTWNLGWLLWRYCQRTCPVTEMLEAIETADVGGPP